MPTSKSKIFSPFLVFSSLLVSGCLVAPLKKQDLTPSGTHILHHHSQSVAVSSRVIQYCEVQPHILQNAIVDGINQAGLFICAADAGRAGYRLDVSLVSIQWPTTGFTMSSKVNMVWKLTRTHDGKVVFHDAIASDCSENMFGTVLGAARSYAAMRGAIRKNVREGLERLGKIDL